MDPKTQYLSVLFNPGELVCSGDMYSTELVEQDNAFGPYISINPLQTKRADANVTAHRNFLIEMDQPGLSANDQLAIAEKAGLPYSTAVWSGSKSVHFIVAMSEAVDEATWRKWAAALIASMPGADKTTKNPSRFTRLAGHVRRDNGNKQDLLISGARISPQIIRRYVEKFIEPEPVVDYRKAYNNFRGLSGLAACHPMTKAFINGTHPCEHGRNNALFRSAMDMLDQSMSTEEIDSLLIPPAVALGLSVREVKRTLLSAYQKKKSFTYLK